MPVIRVSGYPGAGKTTFCEMLSRSLGYEYFYAGKLFRKLATEAGLPIEEYYAKLAADPTRERAIDDEQKNLMAKQDNLIVEGRVAPFLPCSFPTVNILLTVEPEEGARRQQLRKENAARSIAEIHERTMNRIAHEREHYRTLYGINDHFGADHYDIIVDTTRQSADQTLAGALATLKERFRINPIS